MSDQSINYEAVLADLENRKAQLEAAIAGIRLVMGQPGTAPSGPGGGGGGYSGGAPAHDAFIGMSHPGSGQETSDRRPKETVYPRIDDRNGSWRLTAQQVHIGENFKTAHYRHSRTFLALVTGFISGGLLGMAVGLILGLAGR